MDYWRNSSPPRTANMNSYNNHHRNSNSSYTNPSPALDRLLQTSTSTSPRSTFRDNDGYYSSRGGEDVLSRYGLKREEDRFSSGNGSVGNNTLTAAVGYGGASGSAIGMGSANAGPSAGSGSSTVQTAKRGSKACVACESRS
jgi:hypothetical protein